MAKITLFAKVIQKVPKDWIKSLVRKHGTDKHAKGFNTWSHLVSMIFCQFAYDGIHHNTAVRCPQAAGYIQMALLEPRYIT